MAYSRWIDSDMYTYRVSQEDLNSPDDEVFICHWDIGRSSTFTYQEVADFIADPDTLWEFDGVESIEHLHELLRHFRSFIKDVNREWNL